MMRWAPWLLAFVAWNASFDLHVRRAAEDFTITQVLRSETGREPALVRDALTPRVAGAARRATALAGTVLLAGLAWQWRRARASHR
jgi:hypothetical protein